MSFKVLFDAKRPSAIYYFHNDWWNYKGKPVDAPMDIASTGSSSRLPVVLMQAQIQLASSYMQNWFETRQSLETFGKTVADTIRDELVLYSLLLRRTWRWAEYDDGSIFTEIFDCVWRDNWARVEPYVD